MTAPSSSTCEVVDDVLVVRVRDGDRAEPSSLERWSPRSGHGRGLAIVDALSNSWTVDRTHGTAVTARVPLSWETA